MCPALELAAGSLQAALISSTGVSAEEAAELKRIARREGIHLLGPNCLGFQRPSLKLNASAAGRWPARPLALVSQSGALTSAMLDWAGNNAVGFDRWCRWARTPRSTWPRCWTSWPPMPTQSIVVYLEGISNARRFMSALRSAANAKPVVVLKAGRRRPA
jgi:acetyltransferase